MGRKPYEACVRLLGYAGHYWQAFDGQFASRLQDPFDLSFDRFLNAIYWFAIEEIRGGGIDRGSVNDAMEMLDRELSKPLPGREPRVDENVIQDEMAMFKKAQAAVAATAN